MVSENVKNDEKKKKEKKKKSRQNTRVPVAGLLVAKLFLGKRILQTFLNLRAQLYF